MADTGTRVYEIEFRVTGSTSGQIDGGDILAVTEVSADIEAINPDGGTIEATMITADEIGADVAAINPDGGTISADLVSTDTIEADIEVDP